jgi:holo-[acyl-carrier protein] synthase
VAGIVGIGVDLVSIERLRGVLDRYGARFLDRVLTADERTYCQRHQDQAPQVASRFAAKEAALKALGTGLARGIRWRDLEVRRDAQGPPRMYLSGRAAEEAAALGVARIHLSLSHDRNSAVAMVVLERAE